MLLNQEQEGELVTRTARAMPCGSELCGSWSRGQLLLLAADEPFATESSAGRRGEVTAVREVQEAVIGEVRWQRVVLEICPRGN